MDDETTPDVEDLADAAQASADLDRQDLGLVRLLPALLNELRSLELESGACDRVRHARDMAQVALYERIGRLARRDLPIDVA